MTEQVIELSLPNGAVALARVMQADLGGAEKTAADLRFDFKEVTSTLEGLTEGLKDALAKAAPDRVTVVLGLELAVKNG